MKLDELKQLGWGDAADDFMESDKKNSTSKSRVRKVTKLQINDDAAAPAPTTLGELIDFVDIVPGISQMPQGTSRPGSCHVWLGSGKPQLHTVIAGLAPTTEPN